MGVAALLVGIYFLPQFVTRNRRPWHIPGPAPAARTNPNPLPLMTGTWMGRLDGDPALLVVTWQNGPKFRGTLLKRNSGYTDKVSIEGMTQDYVCISDTRILDEVDKGIDYGDWELNSVCGGFSGNALEMSGDGVDNSSIDLYHWSFTHVSTTVYLPDN